MEEEIRNDRKWSRVTPLSLTKRSCWVWHRVIPLTVTEHLSVRQEEMTCNGSGYGNSRSIEIHNELLDGGKKRRLRVRPPNRGSDVRVGYGVEVGIDKSKDIVRM